MSTIHASQSHTAPPFLPEDKQLPVQQPEVTNLNPKPSESLEIEELASTHSHSRAKNFANVLALNASIFVAALDQTIIATAVPTISSDLHSGVGYAWIGGAYLLATSASGPVIAKISDIFGRKSVLLLMVALFFFTSMICALANSMAMLIVGRALQGVAGGGFLQLVAIVTSDLYSQKWVSFLNQPSLHVKDAITDCA